MTTYSVTVKSDGTLSSASSGSLSDNTWTLPDENSVQSVTVQWNADTGVKFTISGLSTEFSPQSSASGVSSFDSTENNGNSKESGYTINITQGATGTARTSSSSARIKNGTVN